jgi:hypothetical protein
MYKSLPKARFELTTYRFTLTLLTNILHNYITIIKRKINVLTTARVI